ncbi:MAG: glycosyltransferase [Candidatus Korobacteraceae bacterium]
MTNNRHTAILGVQFEKTENDVSSYKRAADFLNSSHIDLVCLQHEYGIFGRKAGGHILGLLQRLKTPLVTTLHTVLREPDRNQLIVMQEIAARSDRLIVMSEHSSRFLQNVFGVPQEKIDLISHGIPDMPFVDAASHKDSSTGCGALVPFDDSAAIADTATELLDNASASRRCANVLTFTRGT